MTTTGTEQLVRTALHEVAPDADLDSLRPDDDLRETLSLAHWTSSNSSNCSAKRT